MGSIYMQQVVSSVQEYASSSVNGLLWSNKASVEWNHSKRVHVEAFTGSTNVVMGKNKTVCTPVLVRVTAAPQQPSTPLDIVAVLDVSKSMEGSKERMQAAMVAVIKNLSGKDRLSIVSLEDLASEEMRPTLMDSKGRVTATKAITSIISNTRYRECRENLGTLAMETVHRQIEGTARLAGQENRIRCVMLLSCGEDQLNLTQWIREITEVKFQFCSFDVGAQHNARRFKCVAEAGAGAYHYIVNDSNTSISDAFGSFVCGLRTVVATSVELSLKAEATVSSVEAGGHYYCASSGTEHEIHIAGMHAGERKSFVVYLQDADAVAAENILSITGKYQQGSSSGENDLETCLLPAKDVTVTMNSDVAAAVVRSRLVTEVKEILVKEVKEQIEVKEVKEEIEVETTNQIEEVEKMWKEIKVSNMYIVATSCSTDLLQHIEEDVVLMKKHGHSYMMSWLSCHWWQRATTMSRYSYAFTASSTSKTTTEKNRWRRPCCLGVGGMLFLVLMVMLLRRWRQQVPPPPFPPTTLDVVKHPEWPAMKDGLDGMLSGAKDDRITSFFREKGATSRDMNQQIDQYLYMAILYAAVLRARYEGTSTTALVSNKNEVRSHAEMYIQTMLTRTRSGAIPSLQLASHKDMTQAMSKYLYSTIVQAEVLVTIRTPPEGEITMEEKIKELEDKNSKLEKEKKDLLDKIKELEDQMRICCQKAKECEQKVNAN